MMNLTQIKPRLRLVVFAAAGVIVLIVGILLFSILGSSKKRPPQLEGASNIIVPPQKSPETLPADIKTIREKIIKEQISNNAGDLLLKQTDNYKIQFISAPNVFFVTIYKDPANDSKKDAERWFIDHGLKQENLCDLPVRFILGNLEVRKANPKFTSLPNGC